MSFNRRAEQRDSATKAVSNALAETFSDEFDLCEWIHHHMLHSPLTFP